MATNTYVALDTQTLGSAAASVTFSSIPQTYTDLVLVINGYSINDVDWRFRMGNGSIDSGSNYSGTYMYGDGSGASSYRESNVTGIGTGGAYNATGTSIIQIQNYSNTNTNKTILARTNSNDYTQARVGLWRSTSAVNVIQISPDSGNFASGSTFTLYGIANSDIGAPKAFGGTITQDANYTYHTFGASGTFTPQQSLTADVLVIAGGGGGGLGNGGGGGAGGLVYSASQSFASATAYTCTVGSGGAGRSGGNGAGVQGSNSNVTGGSLSLTAAVGGGFGGWALVSGGTGGSGGGGGNGGNGGSNTVGQGFAGGNGGPNSASFYAGGGGGGAGIAGYAGSNTTGGGDGGYGVTTYSSWLTTTGQGVSGYIAAGGGGATDPGGYYGLGGAGGGGNAGTNGISGNGVNAITNTGSGGGGGTSNNSGTVGGNGGSGIVIIRYAN
jgi:hypothetical protein